MAKYVVLREFPPEMWGDEGIDFIGYMEHLLRSELEEEGLTPVGEPDVLLCNNVIRTGWGAGRAAVEVQ